MTTADPAADVIDLYERYAAAWLHTRGSDGLVERNWLDRFIAQLPASASSILDIGCGGGAPIAAYLGGKNFAVTGVDSAPSLIAAFRERLPDHTGILADMRSLDLNQRFDGLIAWHSLLHLTFDAQRAMFPIFARHAAPGAVLMFTSGDSHSEIVAQFGGDPLYHASLAPEEYCALLAENGFDVVAYNARDPEAGGTAVWIAKRS